MEELSYKDLQIKAKELGIEKVVGVSSDELKEYIREHQEKKSNETNNTDDVSLKNEQVNVNNNDDVDNADNDDDEETLDETKTSIVLEKSEDKNFAVQKRGFRDYNHANNYINSLEFMKLSKPDQEELKQWFKSI